MLQFNDPYSINEYTEKVQDEMNMCIESLYSQYDRGLMKKSAALSYCIDRFMEFFDDHDEAVDEVQCQWKAYSDFIQDSFNF